MTKSHQPGKISCSLALKSGLIMYLSKTDQAREALASKSRLLSQRERAALLMADGTRTLAELSMLAVSRDMIIAVEAIAGHEPADSLSERIAMRLPPEG